MDDKTSPQNSALDTAVILMQEFQDFTRSQTVEHLFILFNSANHPQLPQQYYALDTEQQYTGLLQELLEGYNEQSIPIMPYLVKINKNTIGDNPFIQWLLSTEETRDSFFVLSSHFDLATVAAHWDSLAVAYNSEQQMIILRLFDARISQLFFSKVTQAERQQLMGPCQNFWFPNSVEQAAIISNSAPRHLAQTGPWFHLTQQHEIWLAENEESPLLYNLSLYLWENHSEVLAQYSLEIIETLIAQSLKKTIDLGFSEPEGIYFCASLFFYYSPIFYENQLIQSLWSQGTSEQQHLQNLREKVTEEQWLNIAQPASMDDWMSLPKYHLSITN